MRDAALVLARRIVAAHKGRFHDAARIRDAQGISMSAAVRVVLVLAPSRREEPATLWVRRVAAALRVRGRPTREHARWMEVAVAKERWDAEARSSWESFLKAHPRYQEKWSLPEDKLLWKGIRERLRGRARGKRSAKRRTPARSAAAVREFAEKLGRNDGGVIARWYILRIVDAHVRDRARTKGRSR